MTAEGFRIFSNAVNWTEIFVHTVFYALYVGRLSGGGRRCGTRVWSAFVLLGTVYVLKLFVLTFPGWAAVLLVSGALAGLWKVSGDDVAPERVVFLAVSYYCIQNGAVLIFQSISYVVYEAVTPHIYDMGDAYRFLICFNLTVTALRLGLQAGMLALVGHLLRTRLTCRIRWQELVWLVFTPLIGAFFINIVYRIHAIVKDDTYFDMYEMYPSFLVLVPLTVLLAFAEIAVSVCICGSMRKLEEERLGNLVRERQIKEWERRIAEEDRADEAARRMRHDMRSHLMNLQGLLARHEYEEAMNYIGLAGESLGEGTLGISTGNPVTDVIINDARERAAELDIEFRSDFAYGRQRDGEKSGETSGRGGIELFDLGIVTANLLVNALEACAADAAGNKDKKSYIEISSRTKGNFYLIEVINSFDGKIKWDSMTGLPVSAKRDESGAHGIGLGNVAKVADKYNGSMELTAGDGVFRAVVMLQKAVTGRLDC